VSFLRKTIESTAVKITVTFALSCFSLPTLATCAREGPAEAIAPLVPGGSVPVSSGGATGETPGPSGAIICPECLPRVECEETLTACEPITIIAPRRTCPEPVPCPCLDEPFEPIRPR